MRLHMKDMESAIVTVRIKGRNIMVSFPVLVLCKCETREESSGGDVGNQAIKAQAWTGAKLSAGSAQPRPPKGVLGLKLANLSCVRGLIITEIG